MLFSMQMRFQPVQSEGSIYILLDATILAKKKHRFAHSHNLSQTIGLLTKQLTKIKAKK